MPDPVPLEDIEVIAENAHYLFLIARSGKRWLGFSAPKRSPAEQAFQNEGLEVSPQMFLILSDVSDGCTLGVLDKQRAILLTGALAQDPEQGYGGIDRWHVPSELQGRPEDFRCRKCERIGCDGDRGCECEFIDGEDEP